MAHPKLAQIRVNYDFRCGYCGVSEEDSGGELTVDHFVPLSLGGDEEDENLVYACFRCNVYKSNLPPDSIEEGRRLLHPLRDEIAAHFRENEADGLLIALTERGEFHLSALHLNRPALIAYRQKHTLLALQARALEQTLAENAVLATNLSRLELYLANLEEQLGLPYTQEDS